MHTDSVADAATAAQVTAAAQAALKATLLTPVRFSAGSSAVAFDASSPLDHKVPILLTNPALTLRITGHAYELPSAKDNTALGLARADSAKAYIVIQGVAANRIQTAGHADQKPAGAIDDSLTALRSANFEIVSSPPMLRNP
ncbi:MAG TPA: OmpA family protein [Gemmatimonadaceae bacterium]|jgi:outer membrane protein OmpA-like peptidoglycan-associated protein